VFDGDVDSPYSGTRADVWSLGVLLYAILCQEYPFADAETPWLTREPDMFETFYSEPTHVSVETRELLRGMLTIEPADRWTTSRVLQHIDMVVGRTTDI